MKPRTSVRERISPGLTASLFANYRSSVEALLELVNNFVDSGSPGGSLRVDLSIEPSSIIITGVAGAGMGPEDFRRHYLNWGAKHKRGQLKLGQYGQGGKAAIGFLGSRFRIPPEGAAGPAAPVRPAVAASRLELSSACQLTTTCFSTVSLPS